MLLQIIRREVSIARFAILMLYGPSEAAINKSWKPGDITKVS
jgi:hypothetical protein